MSAVLVQSLLLRRTRRRPHISYIMGGMSVSRNLIAERRPRVEPTRDLLMASETATADDDKSKLVERARDCC